jgi:hypothetical protein
MLTISLTLIVEKISGQSVVVACHFFSRDSLAEAAVSLSAARFSEMAAAVLEVP